MASNKKIASLFEKKRLISKEIKDLQNICEHKNKIIKSIKEYEASSGFIIRCVCRVCEKVIRMPTQQELNKYLNGNG